MALSTNAKATIAELKKAGASPETIKNLTRDLDNNTKLGQQFDRRILSASAFNKYQTQKEQELTDLKNKLTELSNVNKAIDTTQSKAALEALQQRQAELEEALIATGQYNEEEVRNWSLKEKGAVDEILKSLEDDSASDDDLEDDEDELEEGDDTMANKNTKRKYVDEESLNNVVRTSMLNTSRAAVSINAKILAALSIHQEVFGKPASAKQIEEFTNKFWEKLDRGEVTDFDSGLEKHTNEFFKIPEALEAKNKEERDKEIAAAKEEGKKEAAAAFARENGGYTPRRNSLNGGHRSRLFDNKRTASKLAEAKSSKANSLKSNTDDESDNADNDVDKTSGNKKMIDGYEAPVNKQGDIEMWKVRKDFSDRGNIERYTERFDKAVEMNGGVED